MFGKENIEHINQALFFKCIKSDCKNYDNCKQSGNGSRKPNNYRLENRINGKLTAPVVICDDYEIPCNCCQGGGCPVCGGSGFIPN